MDRSIGLPERAADRGGVLRPAAEIYDRGRQLHEENKKMQKAREKERPVSVAVYRLDCAKID